MQIKEILDVQGNYVGRAWKCSCRRLVESFYGHDVVCDCGQLYNSSGQRLNPPEQWEENNDY